MRTEDLTHSAEGIADHLMDIPSHWDGKLSITEMKDSNYKHWRQMEWIGFYFQYLCEKELYGLMTIPGPVYGNVKFDGFLDIPWDFKAHVTTTGTRLIVNDREAIISAIGEYGCVGLILALGTVMYDNDRSFQRWHSSLKGGISDYEHDRIKRGAQSRLRKVSLDLERIKIIRIDRELIRKCSTFQKDFRNADGSPRREKILLNLGVLNEEIMCDIKFG